MSDFLKFCGAWLSEFGPFFKDVLPLWLGVWFFTLLGLLIVFQKLKPRLRTRALKLDEAVIPRARRLRYRLEQADAALEPNTAAPERVLLTWFFRFWTNFASAPSLSVLSFLVPVWFAFRLGQRMPMATVHDIFVSQSYWIYPGLCYFGSMGLSYVTKRVFRRVRPVRDKGAFGHRLRDGSFPSGHSLTAFCFWLPMIAAVQQYTGVPALTMLFATVAIGVVFLTGLSRIYMAVHWPSDIAGGYVIGAVWTVVFLAAFVV